MNKHQSQQLIEIENKQQHHPITPRHMCCNACPTEGCSGRCGNNEHHDYVPHACGKCGELW